MKRVAIAEWPEWQRKLEEIGLSYHSVDGYWEPRACYEFTAAQVDLVEKATNDLQELCIAAVEQVMRRDWYSRMGISAADAALIQQYWNADRLSIYGRFDLAWDGGPAVKMLEYNADTPTSLLECGVAQWLWLKDMFPDGDQFNSIHEKLIARWPMVADRAEPGWGMGGVCDEFGNTPPRKKDRPG